MAKDERRRKRKKETKNNEQAEAKVWKEYQNLRKQTPKKWGEKVEGSKLIVSVEQKKKQ